MQNEGAGNCAPPGNTATPPHSLPHSHVGGVHFQVSTKTGVKLHYFNLHVLVPTAFILGSDEYHTQAGNAISLVCIIENVSGGFGFTAAKRQLFGWQI